MEFSLERIFRNDNDSKDTLTVQFAVSSNKLGKAYFIDLAGKHLRSFAAFREAVVDTFGLWLSQPGESWSKKVDAAFGSPDESETEVKADREPDDFEDITFPEPDYGAESAVGFAVLMRDLASLSPEDLWCAVKILLERLETFKIKTRAAANETEGSHGGSL